MVTKYTPCVIIKCYRIIQPHVCQCGRGCWWCYRWDCRLNLLSRYMIVYTSSFASGIVDSACISDRSPCMKCTKFGRKINQFGCYCGLYWSWRWCCCRVVTDDDDDDGGPCAKKGARGINVVGCSEDGAGTGTTTGRFDDRLDVGLLLQVIQYIRIIDGVHVVRYIIIVDGVLVIPGAWLRSSPLLVMPLAVDPSTKLLDNNTIS